MSEMKAAGLRTGRASISLLDPVMVEAYGSEMPLNQVATVSAPEPRLITVSVWDKAMVGAVEKAMAKDPAQRFQSMAELVGALERAVTGLPSCH